MKEDLLLNSPLNWYGGKGALAQRKLLKRILELINETEAKRFIDAFGGSGVISINVKIAERIYNDINENLTNFFKVLKDNKLLESFTKDISLTLYSEQEYKIAAKSIMYNEYTMEENDIVKRAVDFYIATMQSRNAAGSMKDNVSWKSGGQPRRGMAMPVSSWLRNIDENLPDVVETFREIEVTNDDVFKCIKIWDRSDAIFYFDPPYVESTRNAQAVYSHEFDDEQHKKLVQELLGIKGKAILSGYDNEIYNVLIENGWKKEEFKGTTSSSPSDSSNRESIEVIWYNFELDNLDQQLEILNS